MDILNWLRIKKENLIRTTIDSPQDLVVLGADVSYQKRGDKYQSYAIPAEDFLAPVARPYKVYTALLTQSGGDNPLGNCSDDPQPLIIGGTYTITVADGTADFTNVGAPNNNLGTSFVATGTTPNSWGTSGDNCLEYNTGAPVVTVLENTIGNVWFTYDAVGSYHVMSDALFIGDKTTCITSQSAYADTGVTFIYRDTESLIYIETLAFSSGPADDILATTMLEIRVYN